jgi:splicing factor 3B subunit 3
VSGEAQHKMASVAEFHVGEMVTSVTKTNLVPAGAEVLCYTTLMGGLGILLPLQSREDVEFLTHLEMHMRQEAPPLCGRDHLAYRSSYVGSASVLVTFICVLFCVAP